jgi:hypothetical protein
MSAASAVGTTESALKATGRPRNEYHGYGFGPQAPSRYLLFPAHANITAVELLTFLPNSIHCADVVYRLITNGGSPHLLWAIANTHRDLPVEWSQSSCRQGIYEAMDQAGYENWRFKTHGTFHQQRELAWDETNLDVAKFLPCGQVRAKKIPAGDMPFKNLALDLRRVPKGHDALDLTRMVEYCVQNPHEPWFYPRDYDKVLGLVGGAGTVRQEHNDREAFKRWTGVDPPPPRSASPNALLEADKRSIKKKRKMFKGLRGDTIASETNQHKKLKGGPKRMVRMDEELALEEISGEEGDEEDRYHTSECISATAYATPPENSTIPGAMAVALDDDTIDLMFASQGQVGETDPYSAYAFGGPRHAPPYRQLYRIDLPDSADVSGWAENLRWAFAQNTLFRYPFRPDAWNESPEHMARIVQIRRDQYWMSEEFLAQDEE